MAVYRATMHEHERGEQHFGAAAQAAEWDTRYRERDGAMWSGRPNGRLVAEVAAVTPGRALDLGCGEGADAIWLAKRGWRVTATDVSRVALDRAARQAAAEHVADRIDWQQHDLSISFPAGTFDLVTASYLPGTPEMPREQILRTAASAVAPGGILLILGHAGLPPWEAHSHPGPVLP